MPFSYLFLCYFFFDHPATTEIYTLSLHDALPIFQYLVTTVVFFLAGGLLALLVRAELAKPGIQYFDTQTYNGLRSEEHTSELQSLRHLVCRLLLEKKKKNTH